MITFFNPSYFTENRERSFPCTMTSRKRKILSPDDITRMLESSSDSEEIDNNQVMFFWLRPWSEPNKSACPSLTDSLTP